MDNLAHSLFGATLAQTGLKRLTPLATSTLVIGANLPDIDAVVTVLGGDASLYYRRGMTHGVVALVVLPWLLVGAMMLYDRHVRRRRDPGAPPVRPWPLLLLAYVGVLSHPLLDWLNTYGVRVLMPFDGRWFYGDTIYIIDPWFWLLMAAAVVFAHSRSWLSSGLWIFAGVVTSAAVTLFPQVPWGTKVLWWVGIALIVGQRLRRPDTARVRHVAYGCTLAFCLYLAAMFAGNGNARGAVERALLEGGVRPHTVMAGPMAGNPLGRKVLAVTDSDYHFYSVRWWHGQPLTLERAPAPIGERGPVVEAALDAPSVRGMRNWMRFPLFEVRELEDGYRVFIRDMRYARPDDDEGFGVAVVELDRELRPREGDADRAPGGT